MPYISNDAAAQYAAKLREIASLSDIACNLDPELEGIDDRERLSARRAATAMLDSLCAAMDRLAHADPPKPRKGARQREEGPGFLQRWTRVIQEGR
jgi:hypothetical protein